MRQQDDEDAVLDRPMASVLARIVGLAGGAAVGAATVVIIDYWFPLDQASFWSSMRVGACCGALLGLLFPRVAKLLVHTISASA